MPKILQFYLLVSSFLTFFLQILRFSIIEASLNSSFPNLWDVVVWSIRSEIMDYLSDLTRDFRDYRAICMSMYNVNKVLANIASIKFKKDIRSIS
jgi:hypothetical protein